MSCPRSIVNHTSPAPARNGRASSTSRRNTRVERMNSQGSLRSRKAMVDTTVTGRRATACPAIQPWPVSSASSRDTTNAATGNVNLDDADPADTSYYLGADGLRRPGRGNR
jgi:hypothetical protein